MLNNIFEKNGFRFTFHYDPSRRTVEVFVDSVGHDKYYCYVHEKGEVRRIEVKEGELLKPFLSMSDKIAIPFFKAVSEHLRDNGIKPDENRLEGKLWATEDHLGDMRKIAFKLLKIKEGAE